MDEAEELRRVVPVVRALADDGVLVSVDTSKPAVAAAVIEAGAEAINDVTGLADPDLRAVCADGGVGVVTMHMQGEPRTMQEDPRYDDVVAEVTQFLSERVAECVDAGLGEDLLVLDPGFGFGKTPTDNIELLANLRQLLDIGQPLLIGISRKSTLGAITGRDVDQRVPASVAAAVMAVERGASIVRAHDVAETVDALRVATAVMKLDTSE